MRRLGGSVFPAMARVVPALILAIAMNPSALDAQNRGPERPAPGASAVPERAKIGFLVKQPEEPWFRNEWKFAELAGRDLGFDLIKIGATDGEKVLNGIDALAAQRALGFVICTPDVLLGPAILERARAHGLKVMSVDDRLVDAQGRPLEGVPHMGISSRTIGEMVGLTLYGQLRERGWTIADTGAISISYYELATAKERNEGAVSALSASGFPRSRIFSAPQRFPLDVESGFNAAQIVIAKHPEVRHWLIFGINDETVLGGVRATENRGFSEADVAAVGIGGQGTALVEFRKAHPTGFYATVTISPKRHGYETVAYVWRWATKGIAPPAQVYTEGRLMTRLNMGEVLEEMGLSEK
jgi:L-arabinose transport system substrate-binding protein